MERIVETLRRMSDLGSLLTDQGLCDEAEELQELTDRILEERIEELRRAASAPEYR